jgi:hypothetical protein
MNDRVLSQARARYAVGEGMPADPAREHYAASHRWLACAREALRWSREASHVESAWLARACDAFVRAGEHREAARRWRKGLWMTMRNAEDLVEAADTDPEASGWEERAREASRTKSSIAAYYAAARHALALVRIYRGEPGTTGRREEDVLWEIRRYRRAIQALRSRGSAPTESSRPGLHKAAASAQEAAKKTAANS